MSALENISDLVAIVRDVLIIVVVILMVLSAISVISLVSQLGSKLSSGGLPLGLISSMIGGGGLPSGLIQGGQGKYDMDATTQELISDLGEAFESGNTAALTQKLDILEQHFQSKGWNDAAQLTDEIKQAYAKGDLTTVQIKGAQLASLFKQGQEAISGEASKYGYE